MMSIMTDADSRRAVQLDLLTYLLLVDVVKLQQIQVIVPQRSTTWTNRELSRTSRLKHAIRSLTNAVVNALLLYCVMSVKCFILLGYKLCWL